MCKYIYLFLKLNKKINNSIKIWAQGLNVYFTKNDMNIANKHRKDTQYYVLLGKCKLKL